MAKSKKGGNVFVFPLFSVSVWTRSQRGRGVNTHRIHKTYPLTTPLCFFCLQPQLQSDLLSICAQMWVGAI